MKKTEKSPLTQDEEEAMGKLGTYNNVASIVSILFLLGVVFFSLLKHAH